MEERLGGNIDKALGNAGCKGDIRVVIKLSNTEIDHLQYTVGKGIDQKLADLLLDQSNLDV